MSVYQTILAWATEHSARMVAMKEPDNAKDLIGNLTRL
jgi:F0F1-type ATP synthase gamma subunit